MFHLTPLISQTRFFVKDSIYVSNNCVLTPVFINGRQDIDPQTVAACIQEQALFNILWDTFSACMV
jgi:hypothetical protein